MERTPTSSGSRIARRISGFSGSPVKEHAIGAAQFAESIERPSRAVQHPAQQFIAHGDGGLAAGRNDARAGHQAADVARGHEKQLVAGEADDFRFDLFALRGVDQAAPADRGLAAHGLQRHADHAIQRAFDHDSAALAMRCARLHQAFRPSFGARLRRGLAQSCPAPRRGRVAFGCPAIRSRCRRGASPDAHRCARWWS